MARSTVLLMIFLAIVAGLLGYNYFVRPFANINSTAQPEPLISPEPVGDEIALNDTIAKLSTRQKVAQLIAYPVKLDQTGLATTSAEMILTSQPGIVTLFGSNIATSTARQTVSSLKNSYNRATPIRLLVATEHEGGTVQRLSGTGFTRLPSWQVMCGYDEAERKQLLLKVAKELNHVGIDILFGPVVDIGITNPFLKGRICANEAETVTSRATELIKILQSQEILPVIKHFPGIGKTTQDLHFNSDQVSLNTDDVVVFQNILTQYPSIGVMVSHVILPDQFDNQPCSLASGCVQGLQSTFPEALIFSDALEMQSALAAVPDESLVNAAKTAVLAGNDVLVFGPSVTDQELRSLIIALGEEYDKNTAFKTQVDSAVQKLVEYKLR